MDVSDIFKFSCSREGKGESGETGRGGSVFLFIENPRKGGHLQKGGGDEGARRVSAGNLGGGC